MLALQKLKEYAATDRTAIIHRGLRLSYRELDECSDTFAAFLVRQFGDDRSPVVICGNKELDFLCCALGALKSGRAYVPIEHSMPAERAGGILQAVQPKVIVDLCGLCASLQTGEALVLDTGKTAEILSLMPQAAPGPQDWVQGQDAAYILFTSGSTGSPKGVAVAAGNLDNFCRGVLPWYPKEGGVILDQVSYSFDVSGCAVYAGLCRGMTLFSIDSRMVEEPAELFSYLKESGLTFWVSTPSFAELCVQSRDFCMETLPQLTQFLFCGEVLTHTLCDALAERFPHARVINTYGPTEATVLVAAVEVTDGMHADSRSIPIGRAIDGVTLRLQPVPEEEPGVGQLLILGDSVSLGYWKAPALTEGAFFTDPETGLRGYRTGDLCRCEDSMYYYCGRMDNQLKLNGFRLERQQGSEANLSYTESVEYDDLRILFQICNEKGIEPLFVHVPMHGQWSDYTGFTADRRQQYYENVRQIAGEYGIQMLDLTGYEYEPHFMCDVMHLGWKGWLQVDRALIDYYYAD